MIRVVLDECLPKKLKRYLEQPDIDCWTAKQGGFLGKRNGELIALVDGNFDALVTMDQGIRHQQNIKTRRVSIIILSARSNSWSGIAPHVGALLTAIRTFQPGAFIDVGLPRKQAASK